MPRTAEEIATDAAVCVAAGAALLHLHASDDDGVESLAPGPVGRMLRAVRITCPTTPLNVTTFAVIVEDPRERLESIRGWTELPDLVAANQGEEGIDEISELLSARGVGVEVCVLGVDDTERFIGSDNASRFVRLIVEPLEVDAADALSLDAEMEDMTAAAGITLGAGVRSRKFVPVDTGLVDATSPATQVVRFFELGPRLAAWVGGRRRQALRRTGRKPF